MGKKIVVIGGVAGGATAVARLRRLDEHAQIILFERGPYISFANCGLPYHIGGAIEEREALLVQTPEAMHARFNIDVRINSEVLSINRSEKTVTVKAPDGSEYTEKYDKIILSPGSTPLRPPIPGIDAPNIFSLWNMLDMDRIIEFNNTSKPKTAAVIGGGFIGIEMAENLADLGMDVTIVEMADQVMAPLDFDMAQIVHRHLRQEGLALVLNDGVKEFEYDESKKITNITLNSGQTVSADLVILSIGIRPNSELAKAADLELNERGFVVTDDNLRSSDKDIFAIGDICEITDFLTGGRTVLPLAGPANKQGRIAADNIGGIESKFRGVIGTSVAKVFDLTVASTGQNEKVLERLGKKKGKDFHSVVLHPGSHAGYYPGAMNMTLKLVFSNDGKVLGAQNVGYSGVDKRIDVIATAIKMGATVKDLAELELSYAPPYSSAKDPVNMAGFVAENLLAGITKHISWAELSDLTGAQIIDVRTKEETEIKAMENAINIPLDELRQNLDKLDKNKTYAVFCAIGVRGYAAERILVQNGFKNIYNLTGGFAFFDAAKSDFTGRDFNRDHSHQPARYSEFGDAEKEADSRRPVSSVEVNEVTLNACGLQCPGPILQTYKKMEELKPGDILEVKATDPGFASDIKVWADKTGNRLLNAGKMKNHFFARIEKGSSGPVAKDAQADDKTMIVFSGELDKAIAALIIANGAASMGKKTTLFFTFWGLNILRKNEKVSVKKDFLSKMFGFMMPRGTKKLGLSNMNMMGIGPKMIRGLMKKKNVDSIEDLLKTAMANGVKMVACQMTLDLLGIQPEELIDGVEFGGVATMLGAAEDSNMSLFI